MDKKAPANPEMESPEERFEKEIEELEAPSWRKNRSQLIAIIVLIVVVAAGIYVLTQFQSKPVQVAKGPSVLPIEMKEPKLGKLTSAPTKFRWETISDTKYYGFRILAGGSPVIERAATNPTVTLTDDEVKKLTAGRAYKWEVQAYSEQGRTLGRGEGSFEL